jgi:hypothetical protein
MGLSPIDLRGMGPQRLFGPAQPCPAHPDGIRRPHEVCIADGADILARHRRSYDKGAQIEDPAHIKELLDDKRAARQHSANDRLAQAAPASQTLLLRAAERGANLGAITAALVRLLERYGAAALQDAILEALLRDVPHHNGAAVQPRLSGALTSAVESKRRTAPTRRCSAGGYPAPA